MKIQMGKVVELNSRGKCFEHKLKSTAITYLKGKFMYRLKALASLIK